MQNITYAEFLGRFKIRQKIGQGGYGQVFRAYDCETKQYKAFKKIVLRRNEDPYSFLTEIEIQGSLAHPLVLKIFEFYVYQAHDKHLGNKVQIGITSQLGNASLQKLIRDKTNQFPIEEIINFSFHFTKLFAFFQDLNIVHRDIKPENFVQIGSGLQCKLIDFGLCTHVKDIKHTAGSFAYMSPKLKKMHTHKELRGLIKTNPFKDDVYSFGLTLYELITRQGPSTRTIEPSHKVSSNVLHKTQNQKLAQIIQMMLEYEEEIRPDFNQLYNIFKQSFNFIQQDPVNQIDGYSEKDLAKMNSHQRYAVMKKRVEFKQNLEKTEKKKYQDCDFKKTNKFYQSEKQDESNVEEFERQQVYYIDKQMEEEVSRRKKRHFGNEKVILNEQSTEYTGKNESYVKQESLKYQKTEERYNRRHYENERQQQSPQHRIQNDKTIQIDRTVVCHHQNQNINHQNLNEISQKTVEIPVSVHQQSPIQENLQQNFNQTQNKVNKFYWQMPEGISVTTLVMMKGHIICGCSDGSLRVINPISKNKNISYKITGATHSHEGSKITAMVRDCHGMVWTASEDGKIIKWIRTYLFTQLENDKNYIEEIVEKFNENGQKYLVKDGSVKLSTQVNKLIFLENPKQRITALYCYNQDRYGIGYNDGSVFVLWDHNRFNYKEHNQAVTSIKRQDDEICTGSLDGSIVILDMKREKIRDQKVRCPYGIKNFNVSGDSHNLEFFIATVNGRGYKDRISKGVKIIQDNDEWDHIDVTDALFSNSQIALTLTSKGIILKNGTQMLSCDGGDQWCCMFWDSNLSIAVGSRQGYVCLIVCE